MRILMISGAEVPHTMKWAAGLSDAGIEVGVYTLSDYDHEFYKNHHVTVFQDDRGDDIYHQNCGSIKKLGYFRYIKNLKDIIKTFKPDILHAHYASGNGFLGALAGFHPYIISVWGSDVYEFPQQSFLHRIVLKYNLHKADVILSTSYVMAKETAKYTNKEIQVIPFGIDMNAFRPMKLQDRGLFSDNDIVIGTIKTLEKKYGVEYLIRAFSILKNRHPNLPLKLLIVGDGGLRNNLENLVNKLSISADVVFTGRVPWQKVPIYDNLLDIYVALSESESFGVAIIEAGACGKPVVVSNAGGLPEVVENGVTGYVVPKKDPESAADAIEKLVVDKSLREKMGEAGRERVMKLYKWENNLQQMINIYKNLNRIS